MGLFIGHMAARDIVNRFLTVFLIVLLTVTQYGFVFLPSFSDGEIKAIVNSGEPVILALENYKKQFGFYPKKIDSLVPKYLREYPVVTGYPKLSYEYERVIGDFRDKYHYGFCLAVRKYKPIRFIGSESMQVMYHPSMMYRERKHQRIKKFYKGWCYKYVHIASYRPEDYHDKTVAYKVYDGNTFNISSVETLKPVKTVIKRK